MSHRKCTDDAVQRVEVLRFERRGSVVAASSATNLHTRKCENCRFVLQALVREREGNDKVFERAEDG